MQTLAGHRDWVFALTVLANGDIAAGSGDKMMNIWREHDGQYQCRQTLAGHDHGVFALTVGVFDLTVSAEGDIISGGGAGEMIRHQAERKKLQPLEQQKVPRTKEKRCAVM